jgi:hypothetical protein
MKIYPKIFQPKWSFVKSVPGVFLLAGQILLTVKVLAVVDDAEIWGGFNESVFYNPHIRVTNSGRSYN